MLIFELQAKKYIFIYWYISIKNFFSNKKNNFNECLTIQLLSMLNPLNKIF